MRPPTSAKTQPQSRNQLSQSRSATASTLKKESKPGVSPFGGSRSQRTPSQRAPTRDKRSRDSRDGLAEEFWSGDSLPSALFKGSSAKVLRSNRMVVKGYKKTLAAASAVRLMTLRRVRVKSAALSKWRRTILCERIIERRRRALGLISSSPEKSDITE